MSNDSHFIRQAKQLIHSVKGQSLSVDTRKEKAIELAALILKEARSIETKHEKRMQGQLARMMDDPNGKAFTTTMTDQCFRSNTSSRVANQLVYVLNKFGIPHFISPDKRLGLLAIKYLGKVLPFLIVPLTKRLLRKETSTVILPGEPKQLAEHMQQRRKEGVRINLNHLGEAILGEEEAKNRLQIYLDDLAKPEVEYVSVKISTIYSQINLLSWQSSLAILAERMRLLYRTAQAHPYVRPDGKVVQKFVNLDMEEYRDLHLTVDLFCSVLDELEFQQHAAGIVLQSYLPDSYLIQVQLTEWAMKRIAKGNASIKIRIVKGANLAMEQVEASLRGWPQAPYDKKSDVDANYKRMVIYGCQPTHAEAANLGIASHNIFDVAYALLLCSENEVEKFVCFEMLEGMADHLRRVVQNLAGDMLLYCPAATREEFQNAVAYLVRRLDENTAPENFLRSVFGLEPGDAAWKQQAALFSKACQEADIVSVFSRRFQDRHHPVKKTNLLGQFENEADTDWALLQNREWAKDILKEWSTKKFEDLPIVIAGKESVGKSLQSQVDPSNPSKVLYKYTLATETDIDNALNAAKNAEAVWSKVSVKERASLLTNIAHQLRVHRADLIGVMVADAGKTVPEADVEISEAIDFADYYANNLIEITSIEDIQWKPKGTVLIAPPWNFPCSIPAGGVLAALACANCVIFKPAPESVLTGWILSKIFWEAGVSKDVLQFITCEDDPVGSKLIKDERVNAVVLTGATSTAKLLLKMRPGLDLLAETGGKNAMIITAISDRDLAIKDLIQSAFGHAGQKCSACSLAILESEVYDDLQFRKQLRDAAQSMPVGSAWKLKTKVNPMIREPSSVLLKALTSLEPGEEWLLKPEQDLTNPNLWSPGIKLGVKENGFIHQNELFGPVLGLMRADDLKHALHLANGTPYGLTSGIHSLDEREVKEWMENIEAGNCYVNRGVTGAIVQRQPFGGCKQSSFGRGSKAGGPNYLMQLMVPKQIASPKNRDVLPDSVAKFSQEINKIDLNTQDRELIKNSLESYAFFWNHYFSKDHDPSLVMGQDNILRYVPQRLITLRVQNADKEVDVLRVIAAALICKTPLQISTEAPSYLKKLSGIQVITETEAQFIKRLSDEKIRRVRLLTKPSKLLQEALASVATNVLLGDVLANGRIELLNYLREVCFSIDYHRYGNLGLRENEVRKSLVTCGNNKENLCGSCHCHEGTV